MYIQTTSEQKQVTFRSLTLDSAFTRCTGQKFVRDAGSEKCKVIGASFFKGNNCCKA